MIIFVSYLTFLLPVLKTQRQEINVRRFLSVDAPGLYCLRQVLVDSVGGLVVNTRVPLFKRPLEFLRNFILKARIRMLAGKRNISTGNTAKRTMCGVCVYVL